MANKIQIKRSTSNATVTGLSNGELAFTQAGNVLYVGAPDGSGSLRIGGLQVPGTLTANQALVANSTSGIDKVITANLVANTIWANGSGGSSGQLLTSNGTVAYWSTPAASVTGSDTQVQYNDGGSLAAAAGLTFAKASNNVTVANTLLVGDVVNAASHTVGSSLVANSTGVFHTGTVNGAVVGVGTQFSVNTTQVSISQGMKLSANGSLGSANQVLRSDSAGTAYWADDTGDISAVTAGNGLSGGGTSGDVTLNVLANSGLASNSTGVHIVTSGDSTLIANSSGLYVNDATLSIATSQLTGDVALGTQTSGNYVATITAGNGTSVSGSGSETAAVTVSVLANTGVTANSSGVFIGQPVSTTSNVTFANVVTTLLTSNGNTVLGTSSSDSVNPKASFANNLMPSANVTYDIGSNAMRWREIHASNVHSIVGYFDGNLEVGGDIIVTGNLVTQNVQSVVISDPMIYLAGNNYASDLVDIGFSANYYDGSTQRHTGFFRDATDGIYKLFANSTQELSGNNVVNTAAVGYTTASLVAYLQSGGLVTNATSIYVTANSTVNVNITANVLSVSSLSNNNLVYANSTGHLVGLALGTAGYVLQSNGTAIVYDVLDGGTF